MGLSPVHIRHGWNVFISKLTNESVFCWTRKQGSVEWRKENNEDCFWLYHQMFEEALYAYGSWEWSGWTSHINARCVVHAERGWPFSFVSFRFFHLQLRHTSQKPSLFPLSSLQEMLPDATHWTFSTSTHIDLVCVHTNMLNIILITQLVSDAVWSLNLDESQKSVG